MVLFLAILIIAQGLAVFVGLTCVQDELKILKQGMKDEAKSSTLSHFALLDKLIIIKNQTEKAKKKKI